MITHPAYPVDPWAIREETFDLDVIPQSETMFSVSNGFLGLRGNLDEGEPAFEHGTYINGFYETRPIRYPELAYGYARNHQTMLNVTDGKLIRLSVDGEHFDVRHGTLHSHKRTLDMRGGVSIRRCEWTSGKGVRLRLESRRLVSFEHRHLAAIEYTVEVIGGHHRVELRSELVANESDRVVSNDPREQAAAEGPVLMPMLAEHRGTRAILGHTTRNSGLSVVCGMEHEVDTEHAYRHSTHKTDGTACVTLTTEAEPGRPIRLTKYLAYFAGDQDASVLARHVRALLDSSRSHSFDDLAAEQRAYLDGYWSRGDVVVDGDDSIQQAVRFAQFQMLQAGARVHDTGIPAKGLTGQGYEGHYFWDMETYCLGVLIYAAPHIADRVLRYRHSTLDAARRRANELSHRGAMFPWRTINGEEASPYFLAGTAEYHINADIAHAVRTYMDATGDETFLAEAGAELLVETARTWVSLGYFSERRDGKFCIDGVTGPDEYTALVDNNVFTNVMAAANLAYAAEVVRHLRATDRAGYDVLAARTHLEPDEVETWQRAADHMYLPFDERLGIHGQDDSFLSKEVWDIEHTPPEKFPLLLHFHPLDIYRKQVIKQADLVLGMLLQPDAFTAEQKLANFDYYDPLTVGDSSLSSAIQAAVAVEVGYVEKAYEYAVRSARMDLDNVEHNVRDGIHIAAMAGTWISLVNGFAGMRAGGGRLRFAPALPTQWRRLRFSLTYRRRALTVDVTPPVTTYTVTEGDALEIVHWGKPHVLPPGDAQELVNPPPQVPVAPG